MANHDDEIPGWFIESLARVSSTHTIEVDGIGVHYVRWARPRAPRLVFVHGAGGHTHWWTHVAARFACDYDVLALDLSGHGESERRQRYSLTQWAAEVAAVAVAGRPAGPTVLVGHSMGGLVALAAAATHPDACAGLIVCDTAVEEQVNLAKQSQVTGSAPVYESLETAGANFRTVPRQPHYAKYVMDNVKAHSFTAVEGGYQSKADASIFQQVDAAIIAEAFAYLARLRCPFALLRSADGIVDPSIAAIMTAQIRGAVTPVVRVVPRAGHHPMLDEPQALYDELRAVLSGWGA